MQDPYTEWIKDHYHWQVPHICPNPVCSNLVLRKYPRQTFCSKKCKHANNRNRRRGGITEKPNPRPCKHCGKTIIPDKKHPYQIYCNKNCKALANRHKNLQLRMQRDPDRYRAKRERGREMLRRDRERARANGMCLNCMCRPVSPGHVQCNDCIERYLLNRFQVSRIAKDD